MCGRFSLASDIIDTCRRFKVPVESIDWKARFNLAPNQPSLVVVPNKLTAMVWGFHLPHAFLINARAETLQTKPSFKNTQRCLIPADGFFEWKNKIPFRATLKSGELFAFAGLYQNNTFVIITTAANSLITPFHNRMPAILTPENESLWLDPKAQDTTKLLKPYPDDLMKIYEVSPIVNSWQNDTPECIEPKHN